MEANERQEKSRLGEAFGSAYAVQSPWQRFRERKTEGEKELARKLQCNDLPGARTSVFNIANLRS